MNCKICAKQYLCNKKQCKPIKFSQIKDYGEVRKKKMKIMISQPMMCKTNEQIRKERKETVNKLVDKGYEVIDTILDFDEDKSAIYYLAKSIKLLDKADTIYFMKGWENARGCIIEHEVAEKYGKQIIYEK